MTNKLYSEKPILFSSDMVRAILEGRKKQTRLPMKQQPGNDNRISIGKNLVINVRDETIDAFSPFGKPGDHLFVSRITLTVKRVWVERVQDISEADAEDEGLIYYGETLAEPTPREKFAKLWDSIYKSKGLGWDANPWVWACEFEVNT